MRVLAPAKINLHLRVGPRRDDGFHPLLSWMCTVGLFDTLDFVSAPNLSPGQFLLRCDRADLPVGPENLVCRAVGQVLPHVPDAIGVEAFLHKMIPSGAGLGGGSSDAARTLLALKKIWSPGLGMAELVGLAQSVGSDVPFFLYEPSAICMGRGEKVRRIAPPLTKWAALILPDVSCPTAQVYQEFDRMGLGTERAIAEMPDWANWTKLPAMELLTLLVNDLEGPAFSLWPELARIRQRAQDLFGRPVRMSGSGSSLFTLFDTEKEATDSSESSPFCSLAKIFPVPLAPRLMDDLAAPAENVPPPAVAL